MTVSVSPFEISHPSCGSVELFLQTGKAFSRGEKRGESMLFEVGPLPKSPWRANPDKRRFVYLAWLNAEGVIVRRIKLFAEDLAPGAEIVRVAGVGPDGSPACSRAKILP